VTARGSGIALAKRIRRSRMIRPSHMINCHGRCRSQLRDWRNFRSLFRGGTALAANLRDCRQIILLLDERSALGSRPNAVRCRSCPAPRSPEFDSELAPVVFGFVYRHRHAFRAAMPHRNSDDTRTATWTPSMARLIDSSPPKSLIYSRSGGHHRRGAPESARLPQNCTRSQPD